MYLTHIHNTMSVTLEDKGQQALPRWGEGVEGSNEPPLFIQYFTGKCVRKHPEAPQLIVRVFCVYYLTSKNGVYIIVPELHTKQPSRCYVKLLRVFSTIININRPDGATYCQTVYVRKYSPRARVVSAIAGH